MSINVYKNWDKSIQLNEDLIKKNEEERKQNEIDRNDEFSNLKTDIATGDELHDTLTNDISEAVIKKADLDKSTENATNLNDELIGKTTGRIPSSFTSIVDNTSHILLNHSLYNPSYDTLEVHHNGIRLKENFHYTENPDNLSIDLINWTLKKDEIIDFSTWKMITTPITSDGSILTEKSVNKSKFSEELQSKMDYVDISLAMLLYKEPIISLIGSPTSGMYKYGQTIYSVILNLGITKKTKDVTQVNYKRNGVVIRTNNSPTSISDKYTEETDIVDTTAFLATVIDENSTVVISNSIVFTFVYQMFTGGINKSITTPTETNIKALAEVLKTKQTITQSFTLVDQKGVFAYPTSYGNLTSITDVNGFEILGSFLKTLLTLKMDDGKSVSYNVYTMANAVILSSYNITFKF